MLFPFRDHSQSIKVSISPVDVTDLGHMGLPVSIADSTSMAWILLVSGTSYLWQWATVSRMNELVNGDAEGLTKHVEDVLFKGGSKVANIKGFCISGSRVPVGCYPQAALSKASRQLCQKPCKVLRLQLHTQGRAAQSHSRFIQSMFWMCLLQACGWDLLQALAQTYRIELLLHCTWTFLFLCCR